MPPQAILTVVSIVINAIVLLVGAAFWFGGEKRSLTIVAKTVDDMRQALDERFSRFEDETAKKFDKLEVDLGRRLDKHEDSEARRFDKVEDAVANLRRWLDRVINYVNLLAEHVRAMGATSVPPSFDPYSDPKLSQKENQK